MRATWLVVVLVGCVRAEAPSAEAPLEEQAPCPIELVQGGLWSRALFLGPDYTSILLPIVDGGQFFVNYVGFFFTGSLPVEDGHWYVSDINISFAGGGTVYEYLGGLVGHSDEGSSIGGTGTMIPFGIYYSDVVDARLRRYDIDIVLRHHDHPQCRWAYAVRDVEMVYEMPGVWGWPTQSAIFMAEDPTYPYPPGYSPPAEGGGPGHDTAAADSRE